MLYIYIYKNLKCREGDNEYTVGAGHWGLLETEKLHKNSPKTEKPNTKPSKPKVYRPGFPNYNRSDTV